LRKRACALHTERACAKNVEDQRSVRFQSSGTSVRVIVPRWGAATPHAPTISSCGALDCSLADDSERSGVDARDGGQRRSDDARVAGTPAPTPSRTTRGLHDQRGRSTHSGTQADVVRELACTHTRQCTRLSSVVRAVVPSPACASVQRALVYKQQARAGCRIYPPATISTSVHSNPNTTPPLAEPC
jgi:hypothetical protein